MVQPSRRRTGRNLALAAAVGTTLALALPGSAAAVASVNGTNFDSVGAGGSSQASESLNPLLGVITDRVVLSDQVAAAKWGTDQPIEDPAREQEVLDGVATKAARLGLEPEEAKRVFRDQIEASKVVQRALHGYWATHPGERPTERPDLDQIRPELDRLGDEILLELRDTAELRDRFPCPVHLLSTYAHISGDLNPVHQAGLARAIPSICT